MEVQNVVVMDTSFLEDGCAFDEKSLERVPNLFFNPFAAARYALQHGKDVQDLTLEELEMFRIN